MAKLIFRTKKPRKGFVHYESFMTHEVKGLYDKNPPAEIQKKAHDQVSKTMQELIKQLTELGYDQTKVGFFIHY
jgi:hypothetical protein